MGSCLTLGNELSEQKHMLTKQKTFFGKSCPGREGKGTQESYSAMWLKVSGFIVVSFVSWLFCFLASHLAWLMFSLTQVTSR